jgi:hypothetical protein
MFNDSALIASLLDWRFNYNHPNYFKYIINNIYNLDNEDITKLLNSFNGYIPYSQANYLMYQLTKYITILKKNNYSKKLNYEFANSVEFNN